MKKLIFILFLLIVPVFIQAQAYDTLAFVQIYNTSLLANDSLEFELRIQRNSDKWEKLANATFQVKFSSGDSLIPSEYFLYSDYTELSPTAVITGNNLPLSGYLIEPKLFPDRISITIHAPAKYEDCMTIRKDSTVLVGKFKIIKKDASKIRDRIEWVNPKDYYQALAYKLPNDEYYPAPNQGILKYYKDDNVEMADYDKPLYELIDDSTIDWGFDYDNFIVAYKGLRVNEMRFHTNAEKNVVGYTIIYGIQPRGQAVKVLDSISTFNNSSKYFNPEMISKGLNRQGWYYGDKGNLLDTVLYRGGKYLYFLYGTLVDSMGTRRDSLLDTAEVTIPNAVIVEASAGPNPFSSKTTITFKIDDRVKLYAYATDLLGKEIKYLTGSGSSNGGSDVKGTLLYGLEVDKGIYTTDFSVSDLLVGQGFYEVIIEAYPIDDPSIEISRAIVKLQYVKD